MVGQLFDTMIVASSDKEWLQRPIKIKVLETISSHRLSTIFLPLFKILPCYDFLFRFLRNETVLFSVQGWTIYIVIRNNPIMLQFM